MRKRVTTPDGKTWSGKIEPLETYLREHLAVAVKNINWSGGAEIELLKDSDGKLWFMEMNPRFPAWIFGTAIAGINLPAMLFEAFTGLKPEVTSSPRSNQFTRVVTEIPVLEHTPLPLVSEPLHGQISMSGKYGAGMASLVDIIDKDSREVEHKFSLPWVSKNFVYHEICAVKTSDSRCELYDPTDGVWLDADITKGHNGHFAVRVESSEVLQWQHQTLGGFQWVSL